MNPVVDLLELKLSKLFLYGRVSVRYSVLYIFNLPYGITRRLTTG